MGTDNDFIKRLKRNFMIRNALLRFTRFSTGAAVAGLTLISGTEGINAIVTITLCGILYTLGLAWHDHIAWCDDDDDDLDDV